MTTIAELPGGTLKDLLDRTIRPQGDAARRRQEFTDRFSIMRDNFDGIVLRHIRTQWNETEIIDEISKWAAGMFNPMKRGVRRLAVAYTKRPVRTVGRANSRPTKKLNDFYKSVDFNLFARTWNEYSVSMNTLAVIPMPKRNDLGDITLDYEMVTGSIAEVEPDLDAPRGSVPAIMATLLPTKRGIAEFALPGEPVIMTIDSEAFNFFDSRFRRVRFVEHGLGVFPGAILRTTKPVDDWWDWTIGRGTTRCVAEVGVVAAKMGWTRKAQCRILIALLIDSEVEDADPGEVEKQPFADPEALWEVKGSGVRLAVHDLDKGVQNFMAEMKAYQDECLELMTGAVSTVADPDPANPLDERAAARQHAAIQGHRETQIQHLESFERRLAFVSHKYLTNLRHPDAVDPDRILKDFQITFPPMPYVDTPAERLKYWVDATKFGIADQVDAVCELTGMPPDKALELLKDKAKRRGELMDILVERNMPADPTQQANAESDPSLPGERPEAQTGRFGGRSSPPPAE